VLVLIYVFFGKFYDFFTPKMINFFQSIIVDKGIDYKVRAMLGITRNCYAVLVALLVSSFILAAASCGGSKATGPTPVAPIGAAVVNSDSIITGEIRGIRARPTGYPWQVDVLIISSEDVGNLPNPTKDKIGQVITAKSDTNMADFKVGMTVQANIRYVGDVPLPGIFLYIYNITPLGNQPSQISPWILGVIVLIILIAFGIATVVFNKRNP